MIKAKKALINITDVKVPDTCKRHEPGEAVANLVWFYEKNKCFYRELIVDENNNLVSGYAVYLACKELGFKAIHGLKLRLEEKSE